MREKTYSFTIEEIPIIVTKKRMKNMYLRISKEDGSVRISAPHQMSDERIYRFARSGSTGPGYRKSIACAKRGTQGSKTIKRSGIKTAETAFEKRRGKIDCKMGTRHGRKGIRCYDTQDENTLGFLQCEDTPHQYQSRTGEKSRRSVWSMWLCMN